METYDNYYKALLTYSKEEEDLQDQLEDLTFQFENTVEYKEYAEKRKALVHELHNAFMKRMAEAKSVRPRRRKETRATETPVKKEPTEDSEELKNAISAAEKLSEAEKRKLYFYALRDEVPRVKEEILKDDDVCELHDILVQTVIDYINEKGWKEVDAISFGADGLIASSEYGEWTPSTDSSLTIEGIKDGNRVELAHSM
jgi:hypothetical protein